MRTQLKPTSAAAALLVAFCAANLAPQAAAAAVLPFGSLSFLAPTGFATNTDVIEVAVRFTVDSASPALSFSNAPLTGIDPTLFPTQGYYYPPNGDPRELRTFSGVFGANLNVYAGCSGSFIGDCTPGSSDYSFSFNFGPNSAIGLDHANVAPGGALDFVLGSFLPKAGGAAPGNYSFTSMALTLEFVGNDIAGNVLISDGITLGTQCAGCEFTRAISAVPEPASWGLMLGGLAGLGGLARRRTSG